MAETTWVDANRFVDVLRAMGADKAPVTNGEVMKALGWARPKRYERVRQGLIDAGVVEHVGRGRGRLSWSGESIEGISPEHRAHLLPGQERELYPILVSQLEKMLRSQRRGRVESVEVAVTGDMGRAPTGGLLSRPDLVGVVKRRLKILPILEVHAFEVKADWAAKRPALFEALAYRSLGHCTHTWVILDRQNGSTQAESALAAIKREARQLGIGVLVLTHVNGLPHLATEVSAEPVSPPGDRLDAFLEVITRHAPNLREPLEVQPTLAQLS